MIQIRLMDNSQGKCGRYKVKLRLNTHWSDMIMVLSHVMNNRMRRQIAVAPNDNASGKSSRFKGLTIVRIQTSSTRIAKVCIPPFLFPLIILFRNKFTMTSPMLPGIQCPCFLPVDPPYSNDYALPPSTFIKLPSNILPPPLQLSMLPPSNVTTPLLPYNDPLPLPTMLINTSFFSLPPSSSAIPLSLSIPLITRHRMNESIGLEAHHFPQLPECAQSICRQCPSWATIACLSREWCNVIVHASCGQHALEFLLRNQVIVIK